jgi:2-amino-4-hydroxy-6-hydroxymethyldihydropteridine diphosphokinase
MNNAFLSTGANLGDRKRNLQQANELLEKYCGQIIDRSSIYETAAWGKTDQPNFLNQVVAIETNLRPGQLMQEILHIEQLMGREREEKYGPRIIDIDILFFNNEIINQPGLIIPHPELEKRRFVLIPLAEIIPDFQHPVLHRSIAALLKDCPDELNVNKI